MYFIIGLGNELRSDDGIGIWLVKRLREIFKNNSIIKFYTLPQLYPELIEEVKDAEWIFIIDASIEVKNEWKIKKIKDYNLKANFNLHDITPDVFAGMIYSFYNKKPEIEILHIKGYDFSYSTSFSEELQKRKKYLLNIIEKIIHSKISKVPNQKIK